MMLVILAGIAALLTYPLWSKQARFLFTLAVLLVALNTSGRAALYNVDSDFGGNLQTALDGLACGDTLTLTSGTTYTTTTSPYHYPARACPDNNRVTLRSSNTASYSADGVRVDPAVSTGVAVITTNGAANNFTLTIDRGAEGLNIVGVRITTGYSNIGVTNYGLVVMSISSGGAEATSLAQLNRYITFDRVQFDGGNDAAATKRGITSNARDLIVKDSDFRDFHIVGDESNCWAFVQGNGHLYENNRCEAAGINALVGGSGQTIDSIDGQPSNITYRRNRFTKNPAWYGDSPHDYLEKNVIEFKNVDGFLVELNLIEYGWEDGQNADCVILSNLQGSDGHGMTDIAIGTGGDTGKTIITVDGSTGAYTTGLVYRIYGASGNTPDINGNHVVTVIDGTHVSIPVTTTVEGSGGRLGQRQYWNTVSNGIIRNNVIRHCGGKAVSIGGKDPYSDSTTSDDLLIENNLGYDLSTANWCPTACSPPHGLQQVNAPNVVWRNNTFDNADQKAGAGAMLNIDNAIVPVGFIFEENLVANGAYGLALGSSMPCGGAAHNTAGFNTCIGSGQWTFRFNVIAGTELAMESCSNYPANNTCPVVGLLATAFRNAAAGDYRLTVGHAWLTAGISGTPVGVDMCVAGGFPDPAGDGSTTFSCATVTPSTSFRPRIRP